MQEIPEHLRARAVAQAGVVNTHRSASMAGSAAASRTSAGSSTGKQAQQHAGAHAEPDRVRHRHQAVGADYVAWLRHALVDPARLGQVRQGFVRRESVGWC